MKQGVLRFQYEQERNSTGMTALSGLMTYLELMQAAGLRSSVERHVRLRETGQGWTDSQIVISLILLNLAGGESVMDLDVLDKDTGLCRVLGEVETFGMTRRERRALDNRWRVERRRSVPSESAVFRYLERFHDADEEAKREAHKAYIPSPNEALEGLGKVNAELVGFVQSRSPHTEATLDMDATLVETRKQEALHSYKGYRAYQPLTTYWAEAELIVHSEFRDGNVPAGYQQLRVLSEALGPRALTAFKCSTLSPTDSAPTFCWSRNCPSAARPGLPPDSGQQKRPAQTHRRAGVGTAGLAQGGSAQAPRRAGWRALTHRATDGQAVAHRGRGLCNCPPGGPAGHASTAHAPKQNHRRLPGGAKAVL